MTLKAMHERKLEYTQMSNMSVDNMMNEKDLL